MLVQSKNYKIKCPNAMAAEYITLHNTANDASANNEVQYMINNTQQISFHFAVDDKEVVQGIPLDRNAWHAGDGNGPGNRKSIGIEICYSRSGGERYNKAEANAIQFVARLLKERKWGIDRVQPHKHWSGKNCPHRILGEGRWQQVLNSIQAELNRLEEKGMIRFIHTGGFAGAALGQVHDYLFKTGDGFDCKRGPDGSIVFLIGRFDTAQSNFKECKAFLDQAGHYNKLLTEEEAMKWRG
jgi:N-acetylmuramoyl-L-alanine amidase